MTLHEIAEKVVSAFRTGDPAILLASVFNVIGALFSLLGALLGAYVGVTLTRRANYKQWLTKTRSKVFATFITKRGKKMRQVIDVIHEHAGAPDMRLRDQRINEIYLPLENYAEVVRLYLPEAERDRFEELVRRLVATHATVSLGDGRYDTITKLNHEMQDIFERYIYPKTICRLCRRH